MLNQVRNIAVRFSAECRASVVTTFAIALIPVVGGVGAAVDFSSAHSVKTALQGALDASALTIIKTAASQTEGDLTASARNYAQANFHRANAENLVISASYDKTTSLLTLNGSADVPTAFMGVFGKSKINVAAISKASLDGSTTWAVCVLITEPTDNHTLKAVNKAKVDFTNCMVQVNTANWDAVEAHDIAYIRSKKGVNCFTGDIHFGDITPPKEPTCTMLSDPFASYVIPTKPCDFTNLVVNTNKKLDPGTYCGGININGTATVTFSAGVYYIQNGDFAVLGSASVIAEGVTFLLSGASTNVNIKTTGTLTLSPDRSAAAGQWAGFVFFWDQVVSKKKGQKNVFSDATINASGVFYFAGQKVEIENGAKITMNPGSIVADYLLPDDGSLVLTGTLNSSTQAEKQMQKSLPNSVPRLVQ